jgi:hypothetical protein
MLRTRLCDVLGIDAPIILAGNAALVSEVRSGSWGRQRQLVRVQQSW